MNILFIINNMLDSEEYKFEGSNGVVQFASILTDEKKKLREYKYTLTINSGDSFAVLSDRLHREYRIEFIARNREDDDIKHKIETFVELLIQGLEKVLQLVPVEHHSFCLITIRSESVYFITLINEWLDEWKRDSFKGRPFQSRLVYLQSLLNQIHYKTTMMHEIN